MECYENNNVLNPIDFEQYKQLISEIKEQGRCDAEDNGLYEEARKSAENTIRNYLGCFNEYEVEFV